MIDVLRGARGSGQYGADWRRRQSAAALPPISRTLALALCREFRYCVAGMSNRAVWNVRRRHEWLATPLKGKRLKKRKRARIGLEQARERKAEAAEAAPAAAS